MKQLYSSLSIHQIPIQLEDSPLLVDSGKQSVKIDPVEAEVTPYIFEDTSTHDFGEISFL